MIVLYLVLQYPALREVFKVNLIVEYMGDDYGFAGKRKSKNDKKKQRGYNKYKKGGQFRDRVDKI